MGNSKGVRPWARGSLRSVLGIGLAAVASLAVGWLLGLYSSSTQALAGPPTAAPKSDPSPSSPTADVSSDYARRVVARIYGSDEITRHHH